jgi:hypothetical protein
MKTRPETTACLKLFVLDGDRDTVMVARATTGRNSATSVSSSSPREQRDGWTCFGDESDKFGWTPAALRWAA